MKFKIIITRIRKANRVGGVKVNGRVQSLADQARTQERAADQRSIHEPEGVNSSAGASNISFERKKQKGGSARN